MDSGDDDPSHQLARLMTIPSAKSQTSPSMTGDEERERRASIKGIMQDPDLTPLERRRSIQYLMDGRRRSSDGCGSISGGGGGGGCASGSMSMTAAAAAAAAAFYDSEDDGDDHHRALSSSRPGDNDTPEDSVTNSLGGANQTELRTNNSASGRFNLPSFQRKGRSASLKEFASSTKAVAAAMAAVEDGLHSAERMEKSRPVCEHYDRQCTIIAPCCGLAFGCRICHDDCPVLPPIRGEQSAPMDWSVSLDAQHQRPNREKRRSLPMNFDQVDSHHTIDRFAIEEVICRHCYARQSSKTDNCINCKIQFGEYHCSTCNLWMASTEDPYHCSGCGFCRVGGRGNFKHCYDCGMCLDALLFDNHNCKAGKFMSNCPVCQEDLFSSRCASHEMPCGHAIHWQCFRELTSYDTRCPVCKKTAETHEHMASTWTAMAMAIELQPIPPEMCRVVEITCSDCGEQDKDRRWHFLGVQCQECSSFNTTIDKTTLVGREAALYLGDECDDLNDGSSDVLRNELDIDESSVNQSTPTVEDSISSIAGESETRLYDRLLLRLRTSLDTGTYALDDVSADNLQDSP